MSLGQSGRQTISILKTGSADTVYPTSATFGVSVPKNARGGITHILVAIAGNAATVSGKVTILGHISFTTGEAGGGSGEAAVSGKWFVLAQLNSGLAIEDTTKTSISPTGNDVLYAESLSHVSMYDRIGAISTDHVAIDTLTVAAVFESPI